MFPFQPHKKNKPAVKYTTFVMINILIFLIMKKAFLILAVLAISTTTALTSCSEDEEIKKTMCTCTEEDDYGYYKEQMQLDPASFGATNCSDLAVKLRMSAGYDSEFYYSCY